MTFGLQKTSAALALALNLLSAHAAEFEVAELMDMLSSVKKSEASFTETKHMAMLEAPLVLSGTLSYDRPDRLEKKTITPYSERMSVEGNKLTFETKGKAKVLALDQQPALRAFVESIRATRAGDLPALERFYQLDLNGGAGAWTLTLKPNDAAVRKQVRAIVMSGQNERILQVEVLETGGDRSIMVINEELS
jgi:outer membrane lipoprotein-sorting protein